MASKSWTTSTQPWTLSETDENENQNLNIHIYVFTSPSAIFGSFPFTFAHL